MKIGYTACWKLNNGKRCRMPKGHRGKCMPS